MAESDEMRLIDANALREDWLQNGENEYVYDTNSFLSSLDDAPTIDPETIPIVRQLREELARVTAERDDYKELFFSYRNVCGGHDPQRISELVEADKNGRCFVIPDFVFRIGETRGIIKVPYKSWMGRFMGTKFYKSEKEAAEAALAKEAK